MQSPTSPWLKVLFALPVGLVIFVGVIALIQFIDFTNADHALQGLNAAVTASIGQQRRTAPLVPPGRMFMDQAAIPDIAGRPTDRGRPYLYVATSATTYLICDTRNYALDLRQALEMDPSR